MSHFVFSVYILTNKKCGSLYIGVTNDLYRRVMEHKLKTLKGFTQKYQVSRLVYYEEYDQVDEAIHREKCLKKWKRQWKIKLIEERNPKWKDLCFELVEL